MLELKEIQHKLPLEKLAELIGIQLDTKKQSTRWAWALCPFHNDSDPSFAIDKVHQIAKCFSPSCVGVLDHVGLLQNYEHLDRESAIDRLYQLAGEERPVNSQHDLLYRVMSRLAANITMDPPKIFFQDRGIGDAVLKEMLIGYSPSFDWFKTAIADIPSDEAARLEFFRTDMFDNAIVYPRFDGLGRAAGFISRPFASPKSMKYIHNSGNFPLRPSRLYGQNLVRGSQIVLVEGSNDVLGLRNVGVKNVVGLLGTNMQRLESYLSEHGFSDAVFIADGDVAGKMSMFKAPQLMRVTQIPEDKMDPDEYAKKYGISKVIALINDAKFPFEIKLNDRLAKVPDTLTKKTMLIKELAKDFSEGLHPIIIKKVQDHIAEALGIDREEVTGIFDLQEFDTTALESKLVYHVATGGPMAEDIKFSVKPQMFSDPRYRKQYKLLLEGYSPDDALNKADGLGERDLEKFLDIAKRLLLKRSVELAKYSLSNMNTPLDKTISKIMQVSADISTGEGQVADSPQLLELGIQNALDRDPGKLLGVSLGAGFPKSNTILQGLRPNSMYILAAKQGSGKSALALEWAVDMAYNQGIPTLWISLEMSELSMSVRILSKLTGLSATNILTGNIDKIHDAQRLATYAIKHGTAPLHVYSSTVMNINQIISLIRKMKVLHGIQVVFIDYLQLIDSGDHGQSMYERVGYISRMIKSGITMDKSIGLPVVAIAQLNRSAAKADTPNSEHMGESYKISQDADVVMTIRVRTDDEINEEKLDTKSEVQKINLGNMILNIDKNRDGLGQKIIGLWFNRENLQIREVIE
jgi:DNA primase